MGLKDPQKIRASELTYSQLAFLELISSKGLVPVSSIKSKKDMEELMQRKYLKVDLMDHKGKDVKVLSVTNLGIQVIKGVKNA